MGDEMVSGCAPAVESDGSPMPAVVIGFFALIDSQFLHRFAAVETLPRISRLLAAAQFSSSPVAGCSGAPEWRRPIWPAAQMLYLLGARRAGRV